jgi:hypothetical protein
VRHHNGRRGRQWLIASRQFYVVHQLEDEARLEGDDNSGGSKEWRQR